MHRPPVRFVTDGLNAMIADRKSVSENFSAAAEKTGTVLEKYGTGAEIGTIYWRLSRSAASGRSLHQE